MWEILLLVIVFVGLPFYVFLLGKMQAAGWVQTLRSLVKKGQETDGEEENK